MNMKKCLLSFTVMLAATVLAACGGGGGDNGGPPPANNAPSANAGPDQGVQEGSVVTLDGSASSDADGDPLTYQWSQSGGTNVTLSDTGAAQPQFTAPEVDDAETLTFELVVNDGSDDSVADSVEVTVSSPTQVAFDPLGSGLVPFPNNWFFEGGDGRRLNIPGDAFVQRLNLLDGFSTVNPIRVEFDQAIDGDSLAAGENVRVFEATIDSTTREVLSIDGELQAGNDYIVEMSALPVSIDSDVPANTRLLIKPLLPLKSSTGTGDATGYVVVVTDGIRDIYGFPVQTTESFEAVRGTDDLSGGSMAALENLRQQTVGWTQLLDSYMPMPVLDMDRAVVSFSFTTVSATDSLEVVAQAAGPGSISNIDDNPDHGTGLSGVAVYSGEFRAPYYVDTTDGLWLDSLGGRVTRYDPLPQDNGNLVMLPFYAALPTDPACTKPADGWPVVIVDQGGDNAAFSLVVSFGADSPTHLSTMAEELGERCFASISIQRIRPAVGGPQAADRWRQAAANLIHLVKTLPGMDLEADGDTDFDAGNISMIGHSAGADVAIMLAAVEPAVGTLVVSGPDMGIAKSLDGSPLRQPGLEAGLAPESRRGSATYETILSVVQATSDVFDPVNYVGKIRPSQAVHLIEVYGGGILPGPIGTGAGSDYTDSEGNYLNPGDLSQPPSVVNEGYWQVVETAPLAGTEAMVRVLGLTTASTTLDNRGTGTPLQSVVRFTRGHHSSGYLETFLGFGAIGVSEEWRNQQLEFITSGGVYLPVSTSPQAYVMQGEP